ncbi:unnamed protein product [Bursaphelenchus okinawaensis]|uniref:Lipid droplet-associated hydrolase n=1 Tax=Bursaphelenchus okinawaensis TaxID=465554 RepID=A0A811LHM2_9BILA|nr:unnamed protein product [Bursaphelenchus okinawaensis]CAG9125664.1 unnamed protein product [Bursaphelenchus okinawaensis]
MSRTICEWAKIGGRWTRYSVTETLDNPKGEVLFVIPGNPGNDLFYTRFCEYLLVKSDKISRIFTIAHLNHIPLPAGLKRLDPVQEKERYKLSQQVDHSYDFFGQIIAEQLSGKKVTVIGHSIGAYIGTVLKGRLERDGYKVNLIGLFPTLVDMASTPAGHKMGRLISFVSGHPKLVRFATWIFKWFPIEVSRFLVRPWVRGAPEEVVQAAAELLDSSVITNVGYMADDELTNINELNPKLEAELSKGNVHLYYGTTDPWVPLIYAHEMSKIIGADRVIIDDTGAEHAFVVRQSEVIASKVEVLI